MGGNQFLVSGEVRLATDQAVAGTKAVRSEVQQLANSGISGFEAVQQKVIDLTKRMAELRNTLLQTNDPAAQAQLNASLTQTQTQLRAAKTEMRGMTLESREAGEKVQMLAAQVGVNLPQGIGRLLSRIPAVQTALESAFRVGIILAFAAAIFEAIKNWDKFVEHLKSTGEEIAVLLLKLAKYASYIVDPFNNTGFWAWADDILKAREEVGKLGESAKRMTDLQKDFGTAQKAAALAGLEGSAKLRVELAQLAKEEKDRSFQMSLEKASVDELSLVHQTYVLKRQTLEKELTEASSKESQQRTQKELEEIRKRTAAWDQEAAHNFKVLQERMAAVDKQLKDEESFKLAAMDVDTAVRNAGIKDAKDRAAEATKAAQIIADANIDAAKKSQEAYEKTAASIEQFIDRVFLTARSLSDVFHQFLMQLLGSFVKWISQMLASWLTGVKALGSSGGGGGGGILGGILGKVLGIGGGGTTGSGGGGIVSTLTGGGNLATAGMGAVAGAALGGGTALSLGGGGGASVASSVFGSSAAALSGGAIPAAAGGASAGALGKFAFGGMQSIAPMLAGGLVLGGISLIRAGGPVKGTLGGAMTGAGVAMGLAGLSAQTGILAGLMAVPGIGFVMAGIGALIGVIVGLFSRGKQKKKASALEAQYEKASDDVLAQYSQHQLDYESALDQLGQVLASGQQSLASSGTGKWGGNAAGSLALAIQADLEKVVEIEKDRQARTDALGAMSVPEFAVGGYVGAGLNNGILAVLHPGEFVMQKSAVDSLGANFLSALNRVPRFADGGAVGGGKAAVQNIEVNLHVQAIDGHSVAEFFRRSRGFIVKEIRTAAREGAF